MLLIENKSYVCRDVCPENIQTWDHVYIFSGLPSLGTAALAVVQLASMSLPGRESITVGMVRSVDTAREAIAWSRPMVRERRKT